MASSNADHNHYTISPDRRTSPRADQNFSPFSTNRYDHSTTAASLAASFSPKTSPITLPTSTYTQSTSTPPRRLSLVTKFQPEGDPSRLGHATQFGSAAINDPSPDPYEFYLQHQLFDDPFAPKAESLTHRTTSDLSNGIGNPSRYTRNSSFSSLHSANSAVGVPQPKTTARSRQSSRSSINPSAREDFGRSTNKPAVAASNTGNRQQKLKDLVAKFEQPSGGPPLRPSQLGERVAIRNGSSSTGRTTVPGSRKASAASSAGYSAGEKSSDRSFEENARSNYLSDTHSRGLSTGSARSLTELSQKAATLPRKPLFGEVVADDSSPTYGGYGISPRPRRGSESSIPSPTAGFPEDISNLNAEITPTSPTAWYSNYRNVPTTSEMSRTQQQQSARQHQKAKSSTGNNPTRSNGATGSDASYHSALTATSNRNGQPPNAFPSSRRGSQSKIPLSTRRYSQTSDSGNSSPSTRANSALSKHNPNVSLPKKGSSSIPKLSPTSAYPPRRTQTIKTNALSPARRERTPESPSLTANIITPPPKVSPPLRSSRPRQPVSTASTSASRARAVDRAQSYQGPHGGRAGRSKSQKLPELSNINLAARREMITSAFNRSVKVKDEHAAERRRLTAERHAARLEQKKGAGAEPEKETASKAVESNTPALSSQGRIDPEREVFDTPAEEFPEEERGLTLQHDSSKQSEVEGVTGTSGINDVDSPTLGTQSAGVAVRKIDADDHKEHKDDESPCSSSSEDTEGTMFETEPQVEHQVETMAPSHIVLNHVLSMRDQNSDVSPSSSHPTTTDESPTEDADRESVPIMLRNTAYYGRNSEIEEQQNAATFFNDRTPDNERQDRWSGSSWTDSYQEPYSVNESLDKIEESSPHIPSQTAVSDAPTTAEGSASETQRTGRLPRSSLENEALSTLSTMLDQVSDPRTLDRDAFNEIYRQIMAQSSDLAKQGGWDPKRVTQLCVQQLARFRARPSIPDIPTSEPPPPMPLPLNIKRSHPEVKKPDGRAQAMEALSSQTSESAVKTNRDDTVRLKPSTARRLQPTYRASLNHPDDWAMTSPSIVDWMQFAAQDSPVDEREPKPELPPKDAPERESTTTPRARTPPAKASGLGLSIQVSPPAQTNPARSNIDIDLPPPGHAPPPPPAATKPAPPPVPRTVSPSVYQSQPLSSTLPTISPPQVPHRVTSLAGMRKSHESGSTVPNSTQTPESKSTSETLVSVDSSTTKSSDNMEHKRLKKRRHVIKELIDTENLFGRDMKVVDDIYKGTSSSCAVITAEDIKILFGNSDQIAEFSTSFLDKLKAAAKPIYTIDKAQRFQSKRNSVLTGSSVGTSDLSLHSLDVADAERDRQTTIGKAFLDNLSEMELVYTAYLKNHDAANRKLMALQKDENVTIWLGECKEYASDLTTAWSLDALLVKPVQRIAKFPLLLTQLLESTPADHPDYVPCQDALVKITEIVFRINELKRQADLVEQVVGHRKRKDTDGRTGLSKAFGRRAEKLRQHVGISEMLEDKEYDDLKLEFFYNQNQLEVVRTDVEKYVNSLEKSMEQLVSLSSAMEGWTYWAGDDRGHNVHTRWPEKENKWINYAVVIRQIIKIALPEHLRAIEAKVKLPLKTAEDNFRGYANKFFEKRDKRLLDCAKHKNLKARGDKVDKKGQALIDQFDALNNDIKERIPQFRAATTKLVLTCQDQFKKIQMDWSSMWRIKLGSFVDKIDNEWDEIEKEQKVEEGYAEAEVLCLGACNRSLLEDTPNFVSFRTPSSTLNDGDSSKRSISLQSEGSPIYPVASRNSGNFPPNVEIPNLNGPNFYPDVRSRASSTVSGVRDGPHSPEMSNKSRSMTGNTQASSMGRPSLNQIRISNEPSPQLPRLSVETPSPSLGINMEAMQNERIESSAAAVPGDSKSTPQPRARRASLFTSAMPMGDSPRPRSPNPEPSDPSVLFIAASVYEFNIDKARREAGYPYLTYIAGEIFDVLGEKGELWLARNQDDPNQQVGWIWNKHFARLASS
ncbi:MAG: hypothetical protein Q9227_007949 [Pyrenula ochraceoflavens]